MTFKNSDVLNLSRRAGMYHLARRAFTVIELLVVAGLLSRLIVLLRLATMKRDLGVPEPWLPNHSRRPKR